MSDILTAAFGAVVGAIATYYADIRSQRRKRRADLEKAARESEERRRALATALLIDMRLLEHRMRKFYANKTAAWWRGESPAQLYDAIRPDLVLFSPTTMMAVVEFFGFVNDIYVVLDRVHEKSDAETTEHQHWTIRFKAACALNALNPAVDALVAEGGILPAQEVIRDFDPPNLPTIPLPRLLLRDPGQNC